MDGDFLVLVVGATLLVVPEADRVDAYDDVVNSILLAQLVANKKIETSPKVSWYDTYVSVLDDFWLRHQRTSQSWNASNDAGDSLDFFTAALSKGALGQTRTMAKLLARMAMMSSEEPAIKLLRGYMTNSAPAQSASPAPLTTVRLLVTYANSPSSISTSYIEFKTSKALAANPFQQSYQPDDVRGLVQANHARAALTEVRFGPVREAIALKVRDRRAGAVATLALPREIES